MTARHGTARPSSVRQFTVLDLLGHQRVLAVGLRLGERDAAALASADAQLRDSPEAHVWLASEALTVMSRRRPGRPSDSDDGRVLAGGREEHSNVMRVGGGHDVAAAREIDQERIDDVARLGPRE